MHDFGMLFLLRMKMLWLRICSLFYRRIVISMNVKFWMLN